MKPKKKDRIDIGIESYETNTEVPIHEGFKVIGRIRRINGLYVQMIAKIFKKQFNSNCGEYDVLTSLDCCTKEGGSIKAGHLTELTILSLPAMTNRVDRLEAKGLVFRSRDTADRRTVLIGLTAEGRKMAREMDQIYEDLLAEKLEVFTAEEKKSLENLLRKLVLSFEEDYK